MARTKRQEKKGLVRKRKPKRFGTKGAVKRLSRRINRKTKSVQKLQKKKSALNRKKYKVVRKTTTTRIRRR